jgi:hypothetical protein
LIQMPLLYYKVLSEMKLSCNLLGSLSVGCRILLQTYFTMGQ